MIVLPYKINIILFVYVNNYPYLCIVYVSNDDGFGPGVGDCRGWTPTYLLKNKKIPHLWSRKSENVCCFRFILIFTSHQDFEQLIPYCGENEFYYKYNHLLKKIYINLSFFYVNNNMVITYSSTSWGFNRLLVSGLNLEEGMN
jgi:hypothetical protein